MSHFQSLSGPFADQPSSSDGNTFSNPYLQSPSLLHHLITTSSPSGIRNKLTPLSSTRRERKDKPEEVSFEEGRRRALAATELALASPRTQAKFLSEEIDWQGVGVQESDRRTTAQFYADGQRDLAAHNLPSQFDPETAQSSYTSSERSAREAYQSNYELSSRSPPTRSSSVSSNESSNSTISRSESGSRRANATPQARLNHLRSVPEGQGSGRNSPQTVMASELSSTPPMSRLNAPRSSSIDSAISNLSGQASASERTPEEIANLISAAGSAETLIQHLLKDKAQAASQNAQLWRLVDKQRSMILNLNKDLEKAMKDKDRYRKKLKDQLAAVPPVPEVSRSVISPTPSEALDADSSSLDGKSIRPIKRTDTDTSSHEHEAHPPYPVTPPTYPSQLPSMDEIASESMPDADAYAAPASRAPRAAPTLDLSKSPPPTVEVVNATPGFSRKKAPAPLQLSGASQGYAVQTAPLPVDRSKIREQVGETTEGRNDLTEEEARERLRQQEVLLSPGLPKQMNLGPHDAIRSTTLTAPSFSAKRGVNLPPASLKSPALGIGLPLSPRPIDRPLASPLLSPRLPRTEGRLGGPLSPPLSPRAGFGLPQSPRGFAAAGLPGFGPASPRILSPGLGGNFLTQMMQQPVGNIGETLMGSAVPDLKSLQKEVRAVEKAPGDFQKEADSLDGIAKGANDKLLIVPPALQTIDARVLSTRLKSVRAADAKAREQIVFTLALLSRTNGTELWRIEKDVNTLGNLDLKMRHFANPKNFDAKLPDKSLFASHAPAKVDARKQAIEEYFVTVLATVPLDMRAAQALCEYLSADVVESTGGSDTASLHSSKDGTTSSNPATIEANGRMSKEGFLTKRGKNFGGWKARYFLLDGPVLRYFETKGGAHLGSIRLPGAQIGKQSNAPLKSDGPEAESDNQYRHAFLILEPKRKDSSSHVRHVLCAESDIERDEWVDCLMQYVDFEDQEDTSPYVENRKPSLVDDGVLPISDLRALPYDHTSQGQAPVQGPSGIDRRKDTPSPPVSTMSKTSDTSNGNVITAIASSLTGRPSVGNEKAEKPKKKGIWGFRSKPSGEHIASSESSSAPTKIPISRSVFGAPLGDAVEVSRPADVDLAIPSVVYRSIEYLDARNAAQEEGIFRLSGSSTAIKTLRERFNSQSDINLLMDDEYHDVHAVAGLLKLYLRELPTNVLTRDLHGAFVSVLEDEDKINRVYHLNDLVHRLPIENFTLLRLLAGHLITVIENADINKMSVRNVGIVFSPTLNVPAGVFSLFILEYSAIFIRPGEEGYEEPTYDSYSEPQVQTATTHLIAPAAAIGLPSTPRRFAFDTSPMADEKRRQDQQDFRNLMENTRSEERTATPTYNSGGSLGSSMSLSVPGETTKKKKRESAMLGLFSSSKLKGRQGDEISPNAFDEGDRYDI